MSWHELTPESVDHMPAVDVKGTMLMTHDGGHSMVGAWILGSPTRPQELFHGGICGGIFDVQPHGGFRRRFARESAENLFVAVADPLEVGVGAAAVGRPDIVAL